MTLGGPWLTSAVFCEAESPTDLSVTERVVIERNKPLRLILMMFMVRGDHASTFEMSVESTSPSGESAGKIEMEIEVPDSPDVAARVMIPIELDTVRDGVYWFLISVGERVLTKVPLHVQWATS